MFIIPAIDIMDGKCVRLVQGDFASQKIYSDDPVQVARAFEEQGASFLHIIDLDGAKTGVPKNFDLICRIREAVGIPLEVGGGIRDFETATAYLSAGIDRIILGTKAIKIPTDVGAPFLERLMQRFGRERVIVSVDVRDGKVVIQGWQNTAKIEIRDFLARLRAAGITKIILTDVTRDGTLTTPNYDLFRLAKQFGFQVIAAGGISDAKTLQYLKTMEVEGAIVGKALYEGRIILSSLTKRIIPCLDVKDGRVVKGMRFENLKDAGDPVALAKRYSEEGADELILLDISASRENRETMVSVVTRVAREVSIPFTVGGGIRSVEEIRNLLFAGADKVSINTAAFMQPELIREASERFGSQCIVVAIDAKKTPDGYRIFIKSGSEETNFDPVFWAKHVESLGAGEILLTSIDADGTKKGFDLDLLRMVSEAVKIPVIASGGAGTLEDFRDAVTLGKADAVLAAGLFHRGDLLIQDVKRFLQSCGLPIRPFAAPPISTLSL